MMNLISISVEGKPESQGSKTPIRRGNHIALIEGTGTKPKRLKMWRDSIRAELPILDEPIEEGVSVYLDFRFDRPKSVSVAKRPRMTVKPDLDKLCRAVLDSLTWNGETGVLKDDSRVVAITANKTYVTPDSRPQGVSILILPMESQ